VSYTHLAKTAQIDDKRVNCFELNRHNIVVCKVKDEYFAVINKCSHAEWSFDKGRIRGHRLLCPLHGAIFDIRDGSVISAPAFQPIKTYPLKIEGESILIDLEDD